MGKDLPIDSQQQQGMPTAVSTVPTVPTFNDMSPGVVLGNGIKSVVTLEDVRGHWAKQSDDVRCKIT